MSADWRPNPVVERDLADERRRARRLRANAWALGATGIGLCPLACCGTCAAGYGAQGWLFLAAPAALVAFIAFAGRYSQLKVQLRERRYALSEEFVGSGGWVVELAVFQGEAVTGWDRGAVWFEDGRLYFTGHRSSFGLLPGDLRGPAQEGRAVLETGIQVVLPLRETSPVGPVRVGLRFVSSGLDGADAWSNETVFRNSLQGWRGSNDEEGGQGPPLARGLDLPSVASLRLRAALASAAWPALALMLVWTGLSSVPLALILTVAVGILTSVWPPVLSPRRCWRAVRDRERLDRLTR